MKKILMSFVSLTAVPLALLQAVEVQPEWAQVAAENWVRINPRRMDLRFESGGGEGTETFYGETGHAVFHVVNLKGGGFVVTSGDTQINPIIAFSDSGKFEADEGNPLYALLCSDLSGRLAMVEASARQQQSSPVPARLAVNRRTARAEAAEGPEAEWAFLLGSTCQNENSSTRAGLPTANASEGVSDMRVAPLVKSKWSQDRWNGYDTFNLYTPHNYVSGCAATAIAQVMRYWCAPAGGVSPAECLCWTNKVEYACTMMGGKYAWNDMPLQESDCTRTDQRRAIGTLLYDVGVASQMNWCTNGSGAFASVAAQGLKKYFGYASARSFMSAPDVNGNSGYLTGNLAESADFRNAILASLDAKMPVVIAISEEKSGGHVVVVDGYGYDGSVLVYCHLNCGWNGSENLWYNLIGEGVTSHGFKTVWEVAYNIHPSVSGDVISGRVLDSVGSPVANATVTLTSANGSGTTRTNAKGIYSFRVTPAATYTIMASGAGLMPVSRVVTVPTSGDTDFTVTSQNPNGSTSYDWPSGMEYPFGKLGNLWGVDFSLSPMPDLYPPAWSDWSSPVVVSTSSDTIYSTETVFSTEDELYLSWLCGCRGGTVDADFSTALFVDGVHVMTWTSTAGLQDGYGVYVRGHQLGRFSAGTHAIKIVYDYGDSVAESDEGNNSIETIITVISPGAPRCTVVFDAGGGNASETARKVQSGLPIGTLPTAKQTGYRFLGWWTAKSGGTQVTASTKVTASVTYYAHWQANTLTVTFNPTNGSVSPKSKSVQYNRPYGTLPTPTQAGYSFLGWFTERSGGTQVTASTTMKRSVAHTLYAHWKKAATCTVTFAAGGGNASETARKVQSGSAIGTLPTAKQTGYRFLGWWTAKSGGTQVTASTKVTANMTCYAHWKANTLTVTFNPTNGSVSPKSKSVQYNKPYGTLPTPTQAGYSFLGWFTERSGGTQVTGTTTMKRSVAHTLYAHWKKAASSALTFTTNGDASRAR